MLCLLIEIQYKYKQILFIKFSKMFSDRTERNPAKTFKI